MTRLFLAALLSVCAAASEEEAGGPRTGQGKAVLEAAPERGMRLSEKALRRLGVRTARLAGAFRLPLSALIHSEDEVGLYRLRRGWYKRVAVEVLGSERGLAVVRSGELMAGDEVVISGAPLLRVAELDVLGEEEGGHEH